MKYLIGFHYEKQKKLKEFKPNLFPHDNPFKPSNPPKEGLEGYLGKFPEYKGDPIKEVIRRDLTKTKETYKYQTFN